MDSTVLSPARTHRPRWALAASLVLISAVLLTIGWAVSAEPGPTDVSLQADTSWTLLEPSGWTTSPATVSVLAEDTDGLTAVTAFYRYSTNGGSGWSNWSAVDESVQLSADQVHITKTVASLIDSETDNMVQFRITDKLSTIELSGDYVIAVDSEAPTTVLSTTPPWPASGWFSSTVAANLAASDLLSGVDATYWRLSGSLWHSGVSFMTEGGGTYEFYSQDLAGNSEEMQEVTIQIDNAAPSLSVVTTPPEPGSGWYQDSVTVTISADDVGSGLDGLPWYRLDGGPVQTDGTVVISGSGTHSLHAYARDLAGNLTQHQATIKIDDTPPITSYAFNPTLPPGGWFNGPVTVNLLPSDDLSQVEQTNYRLGTGLWKVGTQFQATGYDTYQYYSVDRAGNAEEVKELLVPIDTEPPSSSYQLAPPPPAGGWYSTTVDISITAIDALSGWAGDSRYSLNGGAEQAGSVFSLSDSGTYAMSFYSRDVAGNVETAQSVPVLCRIDTIAPTVIAVPDKPGLYVQPPVDIHLQASDAHSGVRYVQYRRQGDAAWSTFDHISIPGEATDGTYTYEYRAFDLAGHVTTGLVSVNIDGTPPAAPSGLTSIPNDWTNQDGFGLSWSNPADFSGISGVYYQMDVDPTVTRVGQYVPGDDIRDLTHLMASAEGSHDVYIWLVDGAGNETHWLRAQMADAFKLDTTPPTSGTPTISGPQTNGYYTGAVDITLTGSDNLSGLDAYYYLVNGSGSPTRLDAASPSFVVNGDGRSIIESWAVDHAGNTQTYSRTDTIRIDTTAPAAPINPAITPGGWTKTNSFDAAWVNPLDYSGVKAVYLKKGTAPSSPTDGERIELAGSTSVSGVTATAEGVTMLYVWLEDLAGNADHATAQALAMRYDATAPATAATPSGNLGENGYYVGPVNVSLASTDGASGVDEIRYRVRQNGKWSGWALFGAQPIALTQEGVYDIVYYAVDHAGNQESEQLVSYSIDLTPPSVSAAVNSDYVAGDCIPVIWGGQDGISGMARYRVQVRQGKLRAWQDWHASTTATSGNYCLTEPNQFYYFRIKAWDRAGWESDWSEVGGNAYGYREGLSNPSFDACSYGAWDKEGKLGGDIVYDLAHNNVGTCMALLSEVQGPDDRNDIDVYGSVSQPVALPALDDSEPLVLAFWYRVQTYDTAWGLDEADSTMKFFDPFKVYVRDVQGTELASWLPSGNLTDNDLWEPNVLYDSGWRYQLVDLSPWAGQLVQLDFRIWNGVDDGWPSWAYVDDVHLMPAAGRSIYIPLISDFDTSYIPPVPASTLRKEQGDLRDAPSLRLEGRKSRK